MKKPKKMIPLQELTLLDRFLFSEAVEDKTFLADVLSIIMGEDIVLKNPPQKEKEIRSHNLCKYVKLDVFAEDEQDRIFDTEVQKLKSMLEFFENPTEDVAARSNSDRIKRMQKRVNTLKNSEETGVKYMREWEEKAYERQEGKEEGRIEEREKIAKNLLVAGVEIETIAASTGLTEEVILRLKENG